MHLLNGHGWLCSLTISATQPRRQNPRNAIASRTRLTSIDHIDRPRDQQHLIFPVLDIDLGPRWELNIGAGAGLTSGSDRLIVKVIFGYRFGPLPPAP